MDDKLLNDYLNVENKKSNISKVFTKILISLIIFFSCLIYSNFNEKNKLNLKKYFFEDTFDFMKFKKYYTSLTGNIKNDETSMVFSNDLEIINKDPLLEDEKNKEFKAPQRVLIYNKIIFFSIIIKKCS